MPWDGHSSTLRQRGMTIGGGGGRTRLPKSPELPKLGILKPGKSLSVLLYPPGRGQHLVGAGADADVLSEIHPAHHAGGIHQKLRRPRDVAALRPAAFVQQ